MDSSIKKLKMKKSIIMMLISVMSFTGASAQRAYQSAKPLDNVYIGIQGGANTNMSLNTVFPVNGQAGIRIGKNLNTVLGLAIDGNVWFNDQTRIFNGVNEFASKTLVTNAAAYLNLSVNWTNLFLGYKGEPRAFEVISYTGPGWAHLFGHNGGKKSIMQEIDNDELLAKTALDFAYNIGKEKAWQVYVEPAIVWNLNNIIGGDDVQFDKNHAYLQLSLGVNYKLKNSNGTHNFLTYDIAELNNRINDLQSKLAQKPKEVVREVFVHDTVKVGEDASEGQVVAYFANNSSDLSSADKATLDAIPEGSSVEIKGYTDEYGSDELNMKLSQARADQVKEYLEKKGYTVKSSDGYGKNGKIVARVVVVSYSK